MTVSIIFSIIFGLIALFFFSLVVLSIKQDIQNKKRGIESQLSTSFKSTMGMFGFIFLIFCFVAFPKKNGMYEGDYSKKYTCSICNDPANGGAVFFDGRIAFYYCSKHFEFSKEPYNNENKNKIQCKSCNRYFKKGSRNFKSIEKTNMCTLCYKNFNTAIDMLNELPID